MIDVRQMKEEMQDVLTQNILRFWMTQMVDEENGGFYGRIDNSGVLHPEAEKAPSSMPVSCGRSRQPIGC